NAKCVETSVRSFVCIWLRYQRADGFTSHALYDYRPMDVPSSSVVLGFRYIDSISSSPKTRPNRMGRNRPPVMMLRLMRGWSDRGNMNTDARLWACIS